MTVDELVTQLKSYSDESEVKIFDDWGSGYVLRAISNVLDTTEFEDDQRESPVVVICFDLEAS